MSIKSFLKERREVISYLIVGVLTTVVSLGSYFICVHTFLDPNDGFQLQAANVISWICAVTFAYFTNRKFVFQSKEKKHSCRSYQVLCFPTWYTWHGNARNVYSGDPDRPQ